MVASSKCAFLFFDYVDYDVFLNARVFYRLAGYMLVSSKECSDCDLLVVFRGIPDRVYSEYTGPVHFYDYVREHSIDMSKYFPNAYSFITISAADACLQSTQPNFIHAYLPVIPSIWQFTIPFATRSRLPIHVSNYKPLVDDSYQQQLICLIKASKVRVFGAKWDRVDIVARPLSYLSANLRLSFANICYGLMYPYQRGMSLSGRMWQAPLQGCLVISELHTNFFACPGVLEVSNFLEIPDNIILKPAVLARNASDFWWTQTKKLAHDLNLSLDFKNLWVEVAYSRLLLLLQHLNFCWLHVVVFNLRRLQQRFRRTVYYFARIVIGRGS